jgi:hypothetical protein
MRCPRPEGLNFRVAFAKLLDDLPGFEDWGSCHRENTMAGSIFVTLRMEDTAESVHITSVTNSKTARLA